MKTSWAAPLVAVAAIVSLSSCGSQIEEYSSPEKLVEVFEENGGICPDPVDADDLIGFGTDGAHAVVCLAEDAPVEDAYVLAVFNSAEGRNSYVASLGGSTNEIVAGERWVIVGNDVAGKAGAYGGEAVSE